MKTGLVFSCIFLFSFFANAQQFIPLWPERKMPNSKGLKLKDSLTNERVYQVGVPGMYAFFPGNDDNNGAAVIIFPGGGYTHNSLVQGGFQVAKWFNTLGISAFVVNYRLPNSPDLVQREMGPLMDAQRAIKLVRQNADEWHIQKNKIGVEGSSAGGHLAAWVGVSSANTVLLNDVTDTISSHPDFMILVSPVIDMGEFAHKGSREALLGKSPDADLIAKCSVQNLVTENAPPCFIADAFNDKTVNPNNSLLFYQALLAKKISTSFHVFPQGGHAIGMNRNPGSTSLWKSLCEAWLEEMGFISNDKKIK